MPEWVSDLVDIGFSLGLIAIGLLFAGLALNMLVTSIRSWRLALASKKWPAAGGRVISAQIRYEGVRSPTPRLHLRYGYRVDGVDYTGSRINFEGARLFTSEEVEKMKARYASESALTVYYDPEKPGECTLEQRHVGILGGLVLGAIVLASPSALCLIPGLTFLIEAFVK